MSVTHKEIVRSCMNLLSKVEVRKRRGGKHERVFLTAYQIWILLQEEGNPICQALENEYGTAVGRIAAALDPAGGLEPVEHACHGRRMQLRTSCQCTRTRRAETRQQVEATQVHFPELNPHANPPIKRRELAAELSD